MTNRLKQLTFLVLFIAMGATAQDKFIHNLSKVPVFLNPSFHAFKEKTKIGVLGELANQNQGNQSQHSYAFGSTFFEEYNFQLGIEFFNNSLRDNGYNYTSAAISYIYKLQLTNEWLLYPGITAGYGNYNFNFNNLTFQDQINIFSGQISANTIDPTAASRSIGFLDLGASVMLHNDLDMVFGLSAKHLNQPRLSSEESEDNVNQKMLITGQFGYELNINPYSQSQLPEYSYLYLFNAVSVQGASTRFDFHQDVQLGNISFGINEHFSFMEAASFTQIGFATSITLETLEFGLNYGVTIGNEAQLFLPNALELFLTFDISRFKERGRKDYSKFYE
ncbi:MAG: type IX secretion system PorP/SprF family membrane protein [Maribacter sp.]|jgi:type IX secretion system PorP/SprF family membrane protein